MTPVHLTRVLSLFVVSCGLASCSADPETTPAEDQTPTAQNTAPAEPPPHIQAWMDRLEVEHVYDPETGFIVAREVVDLPGVIAQGPGLEAAIEQSRETGTPVVVFATADRCAPCQHYKKMAINDPAVVEWLSGSELLVTHVEVDREPALAEAVLGSSAIPMTYLLRDGRPAAELKGEKSAKELLAWLRANTTRPAAESTRWIF